MYHGLFWHCLLLMKVYCCSRMIRLLLNCRAYTLKMRMHLLEVLTTWPNCLICTNPESCRTWQQDTSSMKYMYDLFIYFLIFTPKSCFFLNSINIYSTLGLRQTYTGSILIAINPFQRLPHIYDGHMMEQYKGAPFGELSPHVFAIADMSYRFYFFLPLYIWIFRVI